MTATLAVQAAPTRRLVSFHRMVKAVSDRYGVQAAARWTKSILGHQASISDVALRSAIASGNLRAIEAAVGPIRMQQAIERALRDPFLAAAQAAGQQSAAVLRSHGLAATFNATHPNVALFARQQAADLVVGIPAATRQVIAEVIAAGAEQGLTTAQQARAIREVVGLPPNWASAPGALEREIRSGNLSAALGRRLRATDKQRIRSRMLAGTVTDGFIADIRESYARSLIHRRALNIARTETLRSAHAGLNESWSQAQRQGVFPESTRRFWIVTPDERLSPEHARIPGMNAQGRGINESFLTPDGLFLYPPSRPNCRCSVALVFLPPSAPAAPDVELPQPSDADILAQPSTAYPPLQQGGETLARMKQVRIPRRPARKRRPERSSEEIMAGEAERWVTRLVVRGPGSGSVDVRGAVRARAYGEELRSRGYTVRINSQPGATPSSTYSIRYRRGTVDNVRITQARRPRRLARRREAPKRSKRRRGARRRAGYRHRGY